jgi:protein-S-isoprenylcysteine O-methyltransferase Ste14
MDEKPSEPSHAPRDHSGVVFPPPLFYLLFFLAGLALDRFAPLPPPPAALAHALGALLVLSSVAIIAWSFLHFSTAGTSAVPVRPTTALVVSGPYRFTRNPMYLGLLLVYVGMSLWIGLVWPLLLGPALVWVVAVWCIAPEERYLAEKFGEEYHRYRDRVRRWI